MTVYFSGYVFQDDGDALNGATVQLLQVSDGAEEASTTTDSNGFWSFNEADEDQYDVKITSGTSVRYRKWADEISLKMIDVRNNEGAGVPAAVFANHTNNADNDIVHYRSLRGTGADNDEMYFRYYMDDASSNTTEVARMTVKLISASAASEDSEIRWGVAVGGSIVDVFTISNTSGGATDMTMDVAGDINLDADGGDVFFKDGGTTFGSATNNSGNLIIKSGTTTALTFSGANLTAAGTIDSGAITSSGSITSGGSFIIGSASIAESELEMIDGITAGTAAASKAVVLDGSKNIATIGTIGSGAITSTGTSSFGSGTTIGNLTLANGSITDSGGALDFGDETLTTTGAADLGATTVDSLTSTGTITGGSDGSGVDVVLYSGTAGDNLTWDASEEQLIITGTNGATSLNVADGNVTIADDLAVDGTSNLDNTDIDGTLVVDGSNISLDSTATLNIDNSNTSNGITIGTATSAVPISIGHTTSETTINDNLTVTGTLDVAGAVVFNEDSADVDFRIESNGNANMFVVDAGDDAIGIGTASTTTGIALRIDGRMFLDDTASNVFVLNSAGSDYGFIMQHSSDKWSLGHGTSITSLGDPVLSWTDTNQVIIDGSLEVNGGAVFNEGSADADFRIESNGNANMFVVDGGSDVVAIGSAVNANYLLTIGGAHTGGSNSFGVRVEPTITGVANNNASIFNVAGTLVEAGSGTHANLWGSAFSTPTVTGGSASVTNTATVWISGAMSAGTNNYALWVDDGVSRFDGDVGIGETSPDTVLHIKDAAPDITLEDSDGGDVYKIGNNGGNYRVRNVTDSRTDLNIEGGGHVGIGTTSASSYHNFADDLVVYSTGNTGITVATNDTSSGRGALYFSDTAHGTNNPQGYITYLHSNNHMYIGTNSNGSASFYLDDNQNVIFAKTVFINETANANMTTGLTINQGAADDQILALKSSDVNHGLTSYASVNTEIDDFAVFSKMTAGTNGGGLRINAIAEDHSSNSEVFQVWASGGQAATGQTVTGTGLIDFVAMEHNGSNARAAITADGNVFTVRAYMDDGGGVGFHTRFLVDEDGDLFADGTLSAYDTFEDAHLVRALDIARGSKDVIKNEWDNFLKYGEEKLVELGILGDTVENGGLVNVTGLQRLHNGAIWQGYTRQLEQEERIKELETRLLALEGGK